MVKRLAVGASVLFLLGPGGFPSVGGSVGCSDPGSALPVVLVHGFSGGPSDFDPLDEALSDRESLATTRFDYQAHNLDWVTHERIAPALGRLVECLAVRSELEGGPGRVAVVAHSMGGLAVREASRQVGDRLGIVVTIGTPHEGSFVAGPADESAAGAMGREVIELLIEGACGLAEGSDPAAPTCGLAEKIASPAVEAMKQGSPELAALSPFPMDVPVLTIAGQVTLESGLSLGDSMVSEESATALESNADLGGGRYVARCELDLVPFIGIPGGVSWPGSECLHRELLGNPAVIGQVVQAIDRYAPAS